MASRHPFDFHGSQAAEWNLHGERAVVDVCQRIRGGVWHGGYRVRETDGECLSNVAFANELRPIGPVARALLRVK